MAIETVDAVKAFLLLAEDPSRREILIKDQGCLAGLVLLLSNSDPNVVENVLKVLLLLSDTTERKQILSKFLGLREQLKVLLTRFSGLDCHAHELAKNLSTLLECAEDEQPVNTNGNANNEILASQNVASFQTTTTTTHCKKGFFRTGLGKAKNIVLQIYGLDTKEDMELARQGLIGVKGVISITFDLEKKRSHVRTKVDVKADSLANAIISADPRGRMWADQIIRDDAGNEILVPLVIRQRPHIIPEPVLDQNNQTSISLPDYLPDSDFDPLNVDPGTNPVRRRRLSAYNGANVSTSGGSGGGWLSAAANFFADKLTTVF